jgi:dTDP-D-glucose 4,6-dehydratase
MRVYNNTILIVGGMGFVGSYFVEFLMRKYAGDRIIVVDKESTDNLKDVRHNLVFENINIDNMQNVLDVYKPEILISFVPQHISYSCARYLQVLSWDDEPIAADITIRLSHCYGLRQRASRFMPKSITSAIREQIIYLNNDGEMFRDWVHVSDCCVAINNVLDYGQDGSAYLANSGKKVRDRDLASTILQKVELPRSFIEYNENVIEMVNDFSEGREYEKVPSWSAKVDFDEGLDGVIKGIKSTFDNSAIK